MADQIRRTERLQQSTITLRDTSLRKQNDEEEEKRRIMRTLQGIVEAAMRERRRNRLF